MAWMQLDIVETVTDSITAPFRVTMTVSAANGVDREIFVMQLNDSEALDTYKYTATPADMQAYPPSRAAAKASENEYLFYRTDKVTLDFTTQKLATATSVQARGRAARLVKDAGERTTTTFGGASTFLYDSEDT